MHCHFGNKVYLKFIIADRVLALNFYRVVNVRQLALAKLNVYDGAYNLDNFTFIHINASCFNTGRGCSTSLYFQ